jgi:hypothetical protein
MAAGDVKANCRDEWKVGVASLKALPPSRFAKKDILGECLRRGVLLGAQQLAAAFKCR